MWVRLLAAEGKAALFDELRGHLIGDAERGDFAGVSARLRMSEGAVRVAATRLRQDFRGLFRGRIARTVDDPRELDEELRQLLAACG